MKAAHKLYAFYMGQTKSPSAKILAEAAKELGLEVKYNRRESGFSYNFHRRLQPDIQWIEWGSEKYGSKSDLTLAEFAKRIIREAPGELVRELAIEYHIQKLKVLGVEVTIKDRGQSRGQEQE